MTVHDGGMSPEVAYYTTSEIASRYGVDASTVRRWVARGVLRPAATTPGGHHRFNLEDVERLLNVVNNDDTAAEQVPA